MPSLRSRPQVVDYLPLLRGMQWDFATENRRRLALAEALHAELRACSVTLDN